MLRRKWLFILILGVLTFAVTVFVYGVHVRRSASEVIRAASQIHSTADAKQQIAVWQHYSKGYSESQSPDGNGHAYQINVGNGLLARFRIVPKTTVSLEVVTRSDNLQLVVLGMYTEKSSVWVQEDFTATVPSAISVNTQRDASGKPVKAVVTIPARLEAAKKKSVFALSAACFVTLGGCGNTDEILPSLRDLERQSQLPETAEKSR